MAALVVPGFANDADGQTCGGTVIAPYAILTAAHCVVDRPTGLVVVTGKTDLAAAGGQHLAVRTMIPHPDFVNADPFPGDIAVMLLAAPTSAPAIARSTSTPTGGNATAVGWGASEQRGHRLSLGAPRGDARDPAAGFLRRGPSRSAPASRRPTSASATPAGRSSRRPAATPLQLGISSAVLTVGARPVRPGLEHVHRRVALHGVDRRPAGARRVRRRVSPRWRASSASAGSARPAAPSRPSSSRPATARSAALPPARPRSTSPGCRCGPRSARP